MINLIDAHLPAIGTNLLSASVLVTLLVALLCLMRLTQPVRLSIVLAKWAMVLFVLLLSGACLLLLRAELNNDFRLDYVASYNEVKLPLGYKIAAFWAGQSGSLLLWAEMMALMSLIAVVTHWKRNDGSMAGALGTLAVCCGFFTALMLFTNEANPFTVVEGVAPHDGHGLNPMLQDPAMIAHPPFLFLGYAGCLLPYAFMMGALISGRRDNLWIADIRRWTLVTWVFLTIGIVLGSWWAYVELGWGGYWAWDPVENASLLPWLTVTAALHSIMVQQRRGMFKCWNVALISLSFFLCIVGTYITRSGVIDSVHAFPDSPVGQFFFFFLIASVVITIALGTFRFNTLRSEQPLTSLAGVEAAFMATNVLLLIIMVTTLVGTMWPLVSSVCSKLFLGNEHQVTLQQSFYNTVVLPIAIVLFGLMSLGPLFVYGRDAGEQLKRTILAPVVVGAACAIVAFVLHLISDWAQTKNPWWATCASMISGTAATSTVLAFARTLRVRTRATGENALLAAIRMIDSNHRRYGGQMVHIGVILFIIGVVGSSVYKTEQNLTLHQGESAVVAGYTFTFNQLDVHDGPNYQSAVADVSVTAPDGETFFLSPEFRQYFKWEEMNREISVRLGLRRDVYLALGGWEAGGKVVSFTAYITPLISWLWIGTCVMVIGGSFAVLPGILPIARVGTGAVVLGSDAVAADGSRPTVVPQQRAAARQGRQQSAPAPQGTPAKAGSGHHS